MYVASYEGMPRLKLSTIHYMYRHCTSVMQNDPTNRGPHGACRLAEPLLASSSSNWYPDLVLTEV